MSGGALGWLFDCLDQQLFILARPAAMKELIPDGAFSDPKALDLARSWTATYPRESLAFKHAYWATAAGYQMSQIFVELWEAHLPGVDPDDEKLRVPLAGHGQAPVV